MTIGSRVMMALVDRIIDRHARTCVTVVPLERVLLRRPSWAVTWHGGQQIDLATFLRLTFVTRLTPALVATTHAPSITWHQSTERLLAQTRTEAVRAVTTVVERLIARERRVDTRVESRVVEHSAAAAPSIDGRRPEPPPSNAFIVRRAAPAAPKPESNPPAREAARDQAPVSSQVRRTAVAHPVGMSPAIPLSPTELSRLTDDVVRTIDRRLVSYRERQGAI